MQSLHNINLDNYGYSMGGGQGQGQGNTPFQDLMMNQRSNGGNGMMMHAMHVMGESGLSPPYSNQSPPHSVQSNLALSPQGYIGKLRPATRLEITNYSRVHYFQVLPHPPRPVRVCRRRRRTSRRCGTRNSKSTASK